MTTHVKICGVMSVADARIAADAGASAIGLNFVPASPRCVDVGTARAISRALRDAGAQVLLVGVVANMALEAMRALKSDAELGCLQLHGDEAPSVLEALLPHAYKALRIAGEADVAEAARYGGEHLLADAKVVGLYGGSGATFDWSLVTGLAKARRLTLAGGLTPENVADAVRAVRPYCVDVASGVERAPGVKDEARVRAFIANAQRA